MGKVIKKKIQGMSWLSKTGLVLLLTLTSMVFMYEGWYKPSQALAATVTYGLITPDTSSTGVDGNAQFPSSGVSVTTAPTVRGNLSTTIMTTSDSYRPTSGMTNGTSTTLLKLYTPVYATAQTITAPSGIYNVRGYNTSDTWTFHVYSHNPSGTAGNKSLMYSSNTITSGTGSTVAVSPTYTLVNNTMPAGNKLLLEIVYRPGGSTYTPRVYLNGGTSVCRLTVTETAAITDSTPPTAGTVTITPDISSTYTSSAPTITTIFTDAQSAVSSCQYTTNGTTWLTGTVSGAGPNYTCTANPTGLTGFLNINMRATSAGGGPTTATQIQRTVDTTVPTDGVLTVTKGNTLNSLSWTAATDTGGSGIASYILRFATGATAPANCTSGTAVPGSPFSSAILSTTHTGLTNGTQYSYRLCATDNLGNTTGGVAGSATPAAGPVSTITSCSGCHGYTTTFNDGTARNVPAGQFPGSHSEHVITNATACSVCHVAPATATSADFNHANGTITMASPISGGSYAKGTSWPVTNTPTAFTSCNTTTCHGTSSPTWGTRTTQATCTKCHGVLNTTPAQYTADNKTAAPGYVSTAPVGTGRDTGGATAATDPQVGAHGAHLAGSSNYSNPIACTECHANVNPTNASFTGHMNGTGNVNFGTLANTNSATSAYTSPNCTNTYCHFGKSIGLYTPATASASVAWTNTAYLTGTPSLTGDCGKCHASPPSTTGSHAGVNNINQCNGCHSHVSTTGTFLDKSLHINGIVEASGSCIDCHASAQAGTHGTPRDAVLAEFGLAWGHKKAGRGAVSDADCIVCHLEGDYATQKPSAKHKDGNIDLRDPDGAGETPITNISGGAFTFTKFATSYAAGSRTNNGQTSNTDIANVITQKFCIKCHDANGATNPTARSNNGGTGTQYMPFGGINLGANYTVANGAAAAGGLINTAGQFANTNSSYHPVTAPLNRDFPAATRLAAPYNNNGSRAGTSGTKTLSVVLNCFDCHNTPTPLTNRTIIAHGNAVTLRGTVYAGSAASTLCTACHTGYTVTGTHSTGSAWSATGSSHNVSRGCEYCHGSQTSTTAQVRPIRAQDYHGSNARVGGGLWPTVNSRPYAFIRGWSGTAYHRPFRATEFTTGSATCGAGTCPGGGQVGDGSTRTYTAGGSY